MSAPEEKTALIAMSGGVDSSVAAWLMLAQGYACTGVTMRLFRNEDIGRSAAHPCCSQADIDDAAEVAFQLDIPHFVADLTAEFRQEVIPAPDRPLRCKAKVRYRQTEQPATVEALDEAHIRVEFDAPQRAITPGQAVVLYDGDTVLGGGTIVETEKETP